MRVPLLLLVMPWIFLITSSQSYIVRWGLPELGGGFQSLLLCVQSLHLVGVLDMRFRLCCVHMFRAVLMHRYVAMNNGSIEQWDNRTMGQ